MRIEKVKLAKQIVRGEIVVGSFWNKFVVWLNWTISDAKPRRDNFLNSAKCLKQLQIAGFTDDEINDIRAAAVDSGYSVLEYMKNKYPKQITERGYFSHHHTEFQVYQLFLNVPEEIADEFYLKIQKTFDLKMAKLIT